MVDSDLLDILNLAICYASNEHMKDKTAEFFRKVGEYHLEEAIKRGYVKIESQDKPLDVLENIARYLESTGYMQQTIIQRFGDYEAVVEMKDVAVTRSSNEILTKGKQPSHFMTNIMLAALKRIGVEAELEEVEFDSTGNTFKEHWRVLGRR
jgi:predicted methyltransferase